MAGKKNQVQDSRLISETIEKMRDMILSQEPDSYLGSMSEVAQNLGVGIATTQQASRILEHEGLLRVRRGPGGGYYGTRPDAAALQRAFATYLRIREVSYRDAFEMTVSLDCDIAEAAAMADHPDLEGAVSTLIDKLHSCQSAEDRIEFEVLLRTTLLGIVNNPLMELLAQVAMQLYKSDSHPAIFAQHIQLVEWKSKRMKILHAILERDPELAYFEAQRFRRQVHDWTQSLPGKVS